MQFSRSTDIQSSINISKRMMFQYYQKYQLEWSSEKYLKVLLQAEHYHIHIGGELIGFFAYECSANEIFILDMQVLPQFQSQGVGSKVMVYLNDFCIQNNVPFIGLAVFKSNKKALNFYKNQKFHINEKSDIVYKMRKNVT
ncbi:MAG: GNAT family N-acetyltransferase [Cellvibrionaceae bacterium]